MPVLRAKDFEPGVPLALAFLSLDPKEAPDNGYGKRDFAFRTSLGTLYLADDPARDIVEQAGALRIAANEPVQILRTATSHGGSRWSVQRPGGTERALERSLAPPAAPTPAREIIREANASARPIRPAPSRQSAPSRKNAANGVSSAPPAAFTQTQEMPEHSESTPARRTMTQTMCSALCAAINAVGEAEAYAARQDRPVEFSEESIRCLAISMFIAVDRAGGAR